MSRLAVGVLILLTVVNAGCTARSASPLSRPSPDASAEDRVNGWKSDIDHLVAEVRRQHYVYRSRPLPAPSLAGKQIHVHRVALHECLSCGHLMPTPAGQAKIDRCVARGIEFFVGLLR